MSCGKVTQVPESQPLQQMREGRHFCVHSMLPAWNTVSCRKRNEMPQRRGGKDPKPGSSLPVTISTIQRASLTPCSRERETLRSTVAKTCPTPAFLTVLRHLDRAEEGKAAESREQNKTEKHVIESCHVQVKARGEGARASGAYRKPESYSEAGVQEDHSPKFLITNLNPFVLC